MTYRSWLASRGQYIIWLVVLAMLGVTLAGITCIGIPSATPIPTPTYGACVGPEDYPAPGSIPCQRTGNGLTSIFVQWERDCPPLPTGPGAWECVPVYEQ